MLFLEFNTRSGPGSDLVGIHALPRESLHVAIEGGIDLFGGLIKLAGGGAIQVRDGIFRIDVSMNAQLLPVLTLHVGGFFSSDGQFKFDLSGRLNPGMSGIVLFGVADFAIRYPDSPTPSDVDDRLLYIHGYVGASIKAFGVTLIRLGLDVEFDKLAGNSRSPPTFKFKK